MTSDTRDFISSSRPTEESSIPPGSGVSQTYLGSRALPTRQEGYLADEQPAVGKVELAAEDLSRPGPQREGDASRRRVLQILQGHVQSERRGPGLEDPGFKLTLDLVEDPYALRVTVVAVHLEQRDSREDGRGPIKKKKMTSAQMLGP